MTAKSRRRKAAQRVRRLGRQEEQKTYSFYHNTRIVEVVAHTLQDAEDHFQSVYGYHPGATVQERLK